MRLKKEMLMVVLLTMIFIQGCETTKGVAHGVKKDTSGILPNIMKFDAWLSEHLW